MSKTSPMIAASPQPVVTTETFQQHYGRGVGYHGHPPPSQESFHPSPYAPPSSTGHQQHHQHPPPLPPPYPGHSHDGTSGFQHQHPTPPWYYPPQNNIPAPVAPPRETIKTSNNKLLNNLPPSLVTPKSHDSETIPPPAILRPTVQQPSPPPSHQNQKPSSAKGTTKRTAKSKKKDSETKSPPTAVLNDRKEPEIEEEELTVEPMKQDFHYYAVDHYNEVSLACQQQLTAAYADGSIAETNNKENHLFLLSTLINARLIKNWEHASPATRATYLKKEEADRKRFMSEEEVASRHCATLTARKRSPKQSGVERAQSFGLTSTVEVPPTVTSSNNRSRGVGEKRKSDEAEINMDESSLNIFEGEL